MAMNVERPIERIAIDLIKGIDINFMVLFNYSVNLLNCFWVQIILTQFSEVVFSFSQLTNRSYEE